MSDSTIPSSFVEKLARATGIFDPSTVVDPSGDDTVERHPYADHPAALAIHDHIAAIGTRAPTSRAACECGWRGQACDYPAHLAEMLDRAGLLKEDE